MKITNLNTSQINFGVFPDMKQHRKNKRVLTEQEVVKEFEYIRGKYANSNT